MKTFGINHLLTLSNTVRRRITIVIDIGFLALATYLAILISQGIEFGLSISGIAGVFSAVAVTVIVLILSKSYRAIIRHLDVRTIVRIALSVTIGSLIWIALVQYSNFTKTNQLTLLLLQCIFSLFLLIGYRTFLYLYISKRDKVSRPSTSVAIFGLGTESRQFAASLSKSKKYKTVFFFIDDPALGGGLVDGIRVYSEDHLNWALQRFKPSIFVFPQSEYGSNRHRYLIGTLIDGGVEVKLFDGVEQSLDRSLTMEVARPIEIEDLLGRKEKPVQEHLLQEAVFGHHVLVTGAAGSIGSQLCRRISMLKPASLCMMDIDESGLICVRDEIVNGGGAPKLFLGSITDREFVDQMIRESGADTIIHAAAYKHVSMGEECIRSVIGNNVQGTFNLVEAAQKAGIERFIQISTDKAVEPSNVMGATKMWCEKIVSAYGSNDSGQRFASVRFGNVIESRGSVIPKFKEQIANGGPVTVTHPKMQRYFMSIDEAVDLVIQATALTKGEEIFVLDMGEPHYIMDVASSVIQLAGKSIKSESDPNGDIEITLIGEHDVEKLEEKLFSDREELSPSEHPSIKISRGSHLSLAELNVMGIELLEASRVATEAELRDKLFQQIRTFEMVPAGQ